MSVQTVNQFLQAVGEAPQLQEKLNKALEGENSPQPLIDFAAKHGYRFTAEELSAEAQHLQNEFQQTQDAEELVPLLRALVKEIRDSEKAAH